MLFLHQAFHFMSRPSQFKNTKTKMCRDIDVSDTYVSRHRRRGWKNAARIIYANISKIYFSNDLFKFEPKPNLI